MCSTFSSIVGDAKAVYLSAPLTTGRRFGANGSIEPGLADGEPSRSANDELIAQNRERARTAAKRLREELATTVIDPTALQDVDGWTQQDYHVFWEQVIKKYAQTIVFLDDWEYSNGCAYEFLVAQRGQIHCLNERLQYMSLLDGLQLIRKAYLERPRAISPRSKLELIAAELDQLSKVEEGDHALV
jgi:hypothetical protein